MTFRLLKPISIIALFLLWVLLTIDQNSRDALLFPSPSDVWNVFLRRPTELVIYTITTWYRVIAGCFIGGTVGVLFGAAMANFRVIDAVFDPIIELIRPIPPIALTPFFILWFGLGDFGQLLIVSLGCFMVLVVGTTVSINNINPTFIRAAKSLGASNLRIQQTIVLPAILPSLVSALRVSLATGFGLTIAAEYLGAQGGLGFLIRNARVTLETDVILTAVVLLGGISLISDMIIRWVSGKVNVWVPTTRYRL